MPMILALILCLIAGGALAAPSIPTDDGQVLERLRAPGDSQTRELRRQRKALAEDPENLELAIQVARRYLEIGRAEADPRYHGYAQAALRPWWKQAEPPPRVLIVRAILRQARHDFDGALADLSRVLKVRPTNVQAWLSKAVILEVRGDYAGALRSCLPLERLYNALMATACTSSVTSLTGQADKSYRRLSQALGNAAQADPQEQLWALTVLAEMAMRLGRDDDAERHFEQALSLGLRDTYLIGAYADFLLDQGRPREAKRLLEEDTRADALLLRLALAEKQLQSPDLTRHVESLRARFAANRMRGETLHLRTEGRFLLHLVDKPAEALQLATQNWALQREPADTWLLLEAALKAEDRAAARPVLDWLASTKLEDVRIQRLVNQLQ